MSCYFGHHVHPTTRTTTVSACTGKNIADLQHELLSQQEAIIICYDNFQRGVSLLDQRGRHSSSFFRGTHQCAHEVMTFEETSFDASQVPLPYVNEAIPSP